jgi:hypothetical protein
MLSLKADGTPDQHNPEIIGDKETAIEAAKVQFAQQAVAAVDAVRRARARSRQHRGHRHVTRRRDRPAQGRARQGGRAAEKRAESVVNSLHQG